MRVRITQQDLVEDIHEVSDIIELEIPDTLEEAFSFLNGNELFIGVIHSLLSGKFGEGERVVLERMD
jgi:hypothetical protein